MRNTICRSPAQCAESWNCQFVLVFVYVGCLQPRNHLSRFFGLMERNPRILHLWCRFDNYGNCGQKSLACRLSSWHFCGPTILWGRIKPLGICITLGLCLLSSTWSFPKNHLSFLVALKNMQVCWETVLLGVSLMCPLQDAETSLDHQAKSACCLVSPSKTNEPLNFAWSHSGLWSPTFGGQASETLGYNHLVSANLPSMQPYFKHTLKKNIV